VPQGCYAIGMATNSEGKRPVMLLALILSILAIIAAFGLIVAQAYVRWSLNQNFTFLGENVLEALLLSGFGSLIGLLHIRNRN
jgi:hypothetical protein